MKTVLTDYNGNFKIRAKAGDVVRFTSIITERKDVVVTQQLLQGEKNLFEAKIAYYDIQEVIIPNFKVSGNLKKDVLALKTNDKGDVIEKMIGLPKARGNGLPPQLPVAGLSGGGLTFSIDSIYDMISGEKKKKERMQAFEEMSQNVKNIKNYFGEEYFTSLKIPKNLIENFIQFVYSSDNIRPQLQSGNFEAAKPYIEKYLPIYLKRLKTSNLQNILSS